jgi:galactitol-specific phosphotransferase system IIB component
MNSVLLPASLGINTSLMINTLVRQLCRIQRLYIYVYFSSSVVLEVQHLSQAREMQSLAVLNGYNVD